MTVGVVPALGEEQQMLLDASVRFMDERFAMDKVRHRADAGEAIGPAYLRSAGELGWFGLVAGDGPGGSASGNGVLDAALVAAERGARLQPGPYAGHCAVVEALSIGAASTHGEVVARLVDGSAWATWVDPGVADVSVRVEDGALVLAGRAGPVADAAECTWLLVSARGDEGPVLVLVPTGAAGLSIVPLDGLDVSARWSALRFEEVRLDESARIAAPGAPSEALHRRLHALAALLTAADAVGAMHTDFSAAVQYAKDRIAFGRPIGSFQAVKHVLADVGLWLEMAKAMVATAAQSLGADADDGVALAHAAKAFVADRGVELAQQCFQVFGGIGFTWEHDQHLHLRRIAAAAAQFGTADWHRVQLLIEEGLDRR